MLTNHFPSMIPEYVLRLLQGGDQAADVEQGPRIEVDVRGPNDGGAGPRFLETLVLVVCED
jgi:hypothetical protein